MSLPDWRAPPRSCYVFDFSFVLKDLGSGFGMTGHPRRDMDVISRLSKSTIDVLSCFIGFGSLSRVKMVFRLTSGFCMSF